GRGHGRHDLLQAVEKDPSCVRIARLGFEDRTQPKVPRIAWIGGKAELAHLAGGVPVPLVEAEELVAEADRRDPPGFAEPLGRTERGSGVKTSFLRPSGCRER